MNSLLLRISTTIDGWNEAVGKAASWLSLFLVVIVCLDVFLGNVFRYSNAALFELQWHFFALIFLLGAGYTLKTDKHVRVDVFYSKFSPKLKAWVNLLGTLLLLIPFCAVLIDAGSTFTANSWALQEKSADPGGLPGRYLIKGAIVLGAFFLLLQGISILLHSLRTISGEKSG
ncbi:MAG: TRAP transporter small permease subunit [Bacteroidota bacterium]